MFFGDSLNRLNAIRLSPDVNAYDARCAWGNGFFDSFGIEMVGSGRHVAEYGSDFLPLQGMRRGHKREGWHNYFAPEVQRANGNFQSYSSVAHSNAMLYIQHLTDAPLQLPDIGTVVCKPATIQDVLDPLYEALPVANVRPADVQLLLEGRFASKNGKVLTGLFHMDLLLFS